MTVYRIGFAASVFIALGYQLYRGLDRPGFTVGNFFSFFTVQSNAAAALLFLYLALRDRNHLHSQCLDMIRGGITVYMVTTFLVYGVLLAGYQEELQTTVPWVDTVVHRIMPLAVLGDWLIDPPRNRLDFRHAVRYWVVFPLVYCIYSLTRGPIVDWYPYPFLDPNYDGGYARVAFYSVGIAALIVALSWGVIRIGNSMRERQLAPLDAPSEA